MQGMNPSRRTEPGRWLPAQAFPGVTAIVALLAGCAVPQVQRPAEPADLPAQWSPPAPDSAPGGSATPDPALATLQAQALQANRDIRLAVLRWRAAQQQVRLGELGRAPQPSLGLNVSGSQAANSPLPGWRTQHGASASLSYELDLWGRLAAGVAASQAQAQAAGRDIEVARLLIRSQVAEAWWQLGANRMQRALVGPQREAAAAVLEATRARVREGRLAPIEIDRAASTLQQQDLRLAQLAADDAQALQALALLLDQPTLRLAAEPLLPEGAPPMPPLADPARVLERRPDVQRARLGVDAALARLQVSQASRYPGLSFSASVSTGGSAVLDWLRDPVASLAGTLVVPLVDWKRLDVQREVARTELEVAALQLRDTVHRALAEVERLLTERRRLEQAWIAQQARLQEARQAEQQAQSRVGAGALAPADALQARGARLAAEQDAIALRLQQWLNHAALRRALASE
jgi:outer membrane protein TolC